MQDGISLILLSPDRCHRGLLELEQRPRPPPEVFLPLLEIVDDAANDAASVIDVDLVRLTDDFLVAIVPGL